MLKYVFNCNTKKAINKVFSVEANSYDESMEKLYYGDAEVQTSFFIGIAE